MGKSRTLARVADRDESTEMESGHGSWYFSWVIDVLDRLVDLLECGNVLKAMPALRQFAKLTAGWEFLKVVNVRPNEVIEPKNDGGHEAAIDPESEMVTAIEDWLHVLYDDGDMRELRALNVKCGDGSIHNMSGFFDSDHLHELAVEAVDLTMCAETVMISLNPLKNGWLAYQEQAGASYRTCEIEGRHTGDVALDDSNW